MHLTKLFNDFYRSEKSGGIILLFCAILSLTLSNSGFQQLYLSIWNLNVGGHAITHWINDGLMAIFFLLIGLELRREIYVGELSKPKQALLPVIAAVGGMVFPAGIHLLFNYGTDYQSGAGIPVATDIVFALAVLSLVGNRVPAVLKIFLTALAVIDDLGAILVIAIFYTNTIEWSNLGIVFVIFAVLIVFNRFKVYNLIPYLIGGVGIWYFMLNSGIHATLAGVLLALTIPFDDGKEKSPSSILQRSLHVPVAFVVLPLFALANTSLVLTSNMYQALLSSNSLGIIFGLVIGKPVGIVSFSYISQLLKIASLPVDVKLAEISGIGFLGGIGFTMSIFITLLAFGNEAAIQQSKISILLASAIAGIVGYIILTAALKHRAVIKN